MAARSGFLFYNFGPTALRLNFGSREIFSISQFFGTPCKSEIIPAIRPKIVHLCWENSQKEKENAWRSFGGIGEKFGCSSLSSWSGFLWTGRFWILMLIWLHFLATEGAGSTRRRDRRVKRFYLRVNLGGQWVDSRSTPCLCSFQMGCENLRNLINDSDREVQSCDNISLAWGETFAKRVCVF